MKKKISKNLKDKNQLNLIFDDSKLIDNTNNKQDNRLNILISSFLILIFLFLIKLVGLGFTDYKPEILSSKTDNLQRRNIVDSNNVVLAQSIRTYNLYLRPKKIKNKENILIKLKIIFPELNFQKLRKRLNTSNTFIVKRNLTPSQYNMVIQLGEPSIELELSETRIYPHKNLFSHIIGQVDVDNNGISGLEYFFDEELKNKNLLNKPLKLSLDSTIQYIVRDVLLNSLDLFKAKGASAVIINVNNGKIISLVSLPDYDLNKRSKLASNNFVNKNTMGLYEFGSVFKIFTIANAIDQNKIDVNTKFKNLPPQLSCGKFKINEYEYSKDKKNLNTENILVKSSNIGSIRIVQETGLVSHQKFLKKIGLLDKSKIEISEKSTPNKIRWGKCNTLTSSFGHGVNTSLLQLTNAYAAITNGGYLINNSVLKDKITKKKQVISKDTSQIINKILRANVDKNNSTKGSGRKADIEGYFVGGKTGTARKPLKNRKGYSKNTINTFSAIFPYQSPKYAISVLLDEPKGAPKLWGHSRNEAGWNSSYITGLIIKKIGPILDTKEHFTDEISSKKHEDPKNN